MVAIRNVIMLPILACANSALGGNLTTATTTILLDLTLDKNASTVRRFLLRMTLAANAVTVLEEHNLYDNPQPPPSFFSFPKNLNSPCAPPPLTPHPLLLYPRPSFNLISQC